MGARSHVRGNPIDPAYGQHNPNHGHPKYGLPKVDDIPEPIWDLVTDPGAPYGRAENGDAYTRDQWEARYVDENGELIYPGNEGAVLGQRIDYTDIGTFTDRYGAVLDRIGDDGGKYMSFPGTSFEARSLPGSNLSREYSTMKFTGHLPDRYKIEVSEVAPGFGQPGGGLQIRVLDPYGKSMSIARLQKEGMLDITSSTNPDLAPAS